MLKIQVFFDFMPCKLFQLQTFWSHFTPLKHW